MTISAASVFFLSLLSRVLVGAIHLKHDQQHNLLKVQIESAYQNAVETKAIHKLVVEEILHGQDEDIRMEFEYMPGYIEKEKQIEMQKKSGGLINPFIDIDQGLFIRDFGTTHSLVFNKSNVFDQHVLLISKLYQSQKDLLNQLDFTYASQVCQALEGVILFNGGKNSGSSQDHKHIQIVPSEAKQLPIYIAITDYIKDKRQASQEEANKIFTLPHFHFLHGIIEFSPSSESFGNRIFKAYDMLHRQVILMNKDRYLNISDYNFIASDSFAMLVARSQEKADSTISINSLGFIGLLLFKENTYMQKFYREHTPSQILEQITYL